VLDAEAGDELERLLRETQNFGAGAPASASGRVSGPEGRSPTPNSGDTHG